MQHLHSRDRVAFRATSRWCAIVLAAFSIGLTVATFPVQRAIAAPYVEGDPLPIDSSNITPRVPADEKLDTYRGQRDYQYGDYKDPESLLSILSRAFFRALDRLLGRSGAATFWSVFPYAIMIAAALLIFAKLVGADAGAIFRRDAKRRPGDLLGEGEDIGAIDFAQRIAEAEASGMWRDAVRLQYLWTLRHFSDIGAIAWRVDKTNLDYVREVADEQRRSALQRAALLFEYVWYGEFPLKDEAYPRIKGAIAEARS